jgi:diguanylate cyclase (GGDEF)-like protein
MISQSHPLTGSLLVIGETSDSLALLFALLSEYGYIVRSTSPDRPLPELVLAAQPDLILIVHQPFSDGYALCQHFKQSPNLRGIPVLVVATEGEPLDASRLFQAGAADYISYPLHRAELLARIEQQLTLVYLKDQLLEKNQQLQQIENALRDANEGFVASTTLTQLAEATNRQQFENHLAREWRRYARERLVLGDGNHVHVSLIACTIDRLVLYREQFGIKTQRTFLQTVSETLQPVLKRPADYFSRYSQNRFVLLLPSTDSDGALQVIYMIQEAIAKLDCFPPLPDPLTLSFGLASGIPTAALPADLLLKSALSALEQAVQRGGDQVTCDHL